MVRHHKLFIEMAADAKTVTGWAGPKRIVEREQPWFDLVDGETGFRTGKIGREDGPRAGIGMIGKGQTVSEGKRSFQRIGKPCRKFVRIAADHQPVDNEFNVMLALLVEIGRVIKVIDLAIDAYPAEALAMIFGKLLAIFTLATPHDRCQQIQPRAFLHRQQDVDHLADRLAADWQAGCRRIGNPNSGPEEAHIIIDFGDGADSRAWIA